MIDAALVVLQNITNSEREQSLCSEMSPATSNEACQVFSIQAEVLSDAEPEEDPDPIAYLGIKAEPEVSCVSVTMSGRFH
jgi:hypothetical protein